MLRLDFLHWYPVPQLGPNPCWAWQHLLRASTSRLEFQEPCTHILMQGLQTLTVLGQTGKKTALLPLSMGSAKNPSYGAAPKHTSFVLHHWAWSTGKEISPASVQENMSVVPQAYFRKPLRTHYCAAVPIKSQSGGGRSSEAFSITCWHLHLTSPA